jgi:hypothetical protein
MTLKLFELPTKAVDNSVIILFFRSFSIGFYYSYVILNSFKTKITFCLFSSAWKIVVDKKMHAIQFFILLFVLAHKVCINIFGSEAFMII